LLAFVGTRDKYRTPNASFLNKRGKIKRPMNAFMVWARSHRTKMIEHNARSTNSEISMKLGDLWNQMTHEEKQPFYEEAKLIKDKHKEQFPG